MLQRNKARDGFIIQLLWAFSAAAVIWNTEQPQIIGNRIAEAQLRVKYIGKETIDKYFSGFEWLFLEEEYGSEFCLGFDLDRIAEPILQHEGLGMDGGSKALCAPVDTGAQNSCLAFYNQQSCCGVINSCSSGVVENNVNVDRPVFRAFEKQFYLTNKYYNKKEISGPNYIITEIIDKTINEDTVDMVIVIKRGYFDWVNINLNPIYALEFFVRALSKAVVCTNIEYVNIEDDVSVEVFQRAIRCKLKVLAKYSEKILIQLGKFFYNVCFHLPAKYALTSECSWKFRELPDVNGYKYIKYYCLGNYQTIEEMIKNKENFFKNLGAKQLKTVQIVNNEKIRKTLGITDIQVFLISMSCLGSNKW